MNSKAWIVASVLVATGTAQATCYSVHRADGSLILETSTTPVNLTLPLGDTVPAKFGHGAFMTMSDLGVFCKDRRGAQGTQKVVAVAAPGKKGADVTPQAPVEQLSDEELLALKPEALAATPPVQAVDVKTDPPAQGKPEADSGKEPDQVDAGEAAGKVAARE